jgi:ankyrin repeat protein
MTQVEEFSKIWNSNSLTEQIELTKSYLKKYPNIDELVGEYDSWKNTLLHLACHVKNLDLVKFLLGQGADVNVHHRGSTTLHATIDERNKHNNEFAIIKLLAENGVNIRQKLEGGFNQSGFIMALQCGTLEIVEYLDKNYPESCSKSPEFLHRGIHSASSNDRDSSVLAYCLSIDQDVNRIDEFGEAPIHNTYNEIDRMEQLLRCGADINIQDKNGATVLHLSVDYEIDGVFNNDEELSTVNTAYILQNGADKTIKNNRGLTALELAIKEFGGLEYIELFDKY